MGALTVRTSSGMVAENRRVCLLIKIRTLSSMNREPDTPRNDSSIRQEGYDCLQVFPEASIKQAICLIEDQALETREKRCETSILEEVEEAARCLQCALVN